MTLKTFRSEARLLFKNSKIFWCLLLKQQGHREILNFQSKKSLTRKTVFLMRWSLIALVIGAAESCKVLIETETEYQVEYTGNLGVELSPDLIVSRVVGLCILIEVGDRITKAGSDDIGDLTPRDAFQAIKESSMVTFRKARPRQLGNYYRLELMFQSGNSLILNSTLGIGLPPKQICTRKEVVASSHDPFGCKDVMDDELYRDKIVIVKRGVCSFAEKGSTFKNIQGLIIVNNQRNLLMEMKGIDPDTPFPVTMISQDVFEAFPVSNAYARMGEPCALNDRHEKKKSEEKLTSSGKLIVGQNNEFDFISSKFSNALRGQVNISRKFSLFSYSDDITDYLVDLNPDVLAIIVSPNSSVFPVTGPMPSRIAAPVITVSADAGKFIRMFSSVELSPRNNIEHQWSIFNNLNLNVSTTTRRRLLGRLKKINQGNPCWETHVDYLFKIF